MPWRWRFGPWGCSLRFTLATFVQTCGYLRPDLRLTASQLSSVVNGIATILMFVFIDPYLSLMTDEVMEGKVEEPHFRRSIVWLTGSRLAGTVIAQIILVPAALWIVAVADWL